MATKKSVPTKKFAPKAASAKPIKEALTKLGLIAHIAEVCAVAASVHESNNNLAEPKEALIGVRLILIRTKAPDRAGDLSFVDSEL